MDTVVLINPHNEIRGREIMADGFSFLHGRRLELPASRLDDGLMERLRRQGYVPLKEHEEAQRQREAAEIEARQYPIHAADIVRYCIAQHVGLEVRSGRLWVNAPDGCDVVVMRCIEHYKVDVIAELERRQAAWRVV